MKKRLFIFLVVITVLFGYLELGFAEELEPEAEMPIMADLSTEPDILWLWGEVASVDIANNKILVKYLDYETDTEKEIEIIVDNDTKYENVNSLAEIKPNDTVSVDYIVDKQNNNLAKNISVERIESEEEMPEGFIQEDTPLNEPTEEPVISP